MNKIATILCVLVFCPSVVFAQDKARAIVEKAIQAQGGDAKVAKLRIMRIKAEGTAALVPGQPDLPFTMEDTWQMPDRYKSSSTFQITGKKVAQTQVIDGDKGWIQMNGQTQDLPSEAVAEMKEQKSAEDLDRFAFLKETGVELSAVDTIRVGGKPAVGVLVKSKGHREVKLYFDTTSGLLAKREHRLLDPSSGKEALQEVIFSDYQEKDGLKHYKKIFAFRDGKKVFDATVTEVEFFDKLDEKVFAIRTIIAQPPQLLVRACRRYLPVNLPASLFAFLARRISVRPPSVPSPLARIVFSSSPQRSRAVIR